MISFFFILLKHLALAPTGAAVSDPIFGSRTVTIINLMAAPGAIDLTEKVKKQFPSTTDAEINELQRQFDTFDLDGSGKYVTCLTHRTPPPLLAVSLTSFPPPLAVSLTLNSLVFLKF